MNSLVELEERLEALESRIAFQDQTIDDLSSVITDQQSQIENLSLKVRQLLEQVGPPSIVKDDDTTPPHY